MHKYYSIKSIHESLKDRLENYIETEYLGKNNELRNVVSNLLKEKGVIYNDLMVEANCGYEMSDIPLEEANLPENIKKIYKNLVETNLGFFKYPYKHQVNAMESFFAGKDLLVSTGTGSGKTECFLWPMITKLISEAQRKNTSWDQRGVRAIILYPMNALVSDQESRLRRMIGDYDNIFLNTFNMMTGNKRRPQFGMYTGRTKYSGDENKADDRKLAETLENAFVNIDGSKEKEKMILKLKKLGKYPAKNNIEAFIENLKQGKHLTDDLDAELITRFEMMEITPDILITNYSMLDYMMVRNKEQNIWQDTRNWLSIDGNKLLFIIDEAHMYKGSSGAEVALLIKRFMSNLNIKRDKVQFILTSASFPKNSETEINQFACDLTNQNIELNNFEIITGTPKKFEEYNLVHINVPEVFHFDLNDLYGEFDRKVDIIKTSFEKMKIRMNDFTPSNDNELGEYLYKFLPKIGQVIELINFTRGSAKSIAAIKDKIFHKDNDKAATNVVEFLLSILPLAKNKDNQVLFPTRIHMMFRGINGIYACSNPNCKFKNHHLSFGKVFVNASDRRCECGGKIYELVNERNCGALFLKFYEDNKYPTFAWNTQAYNNYLTDTYAYLPDETDGEEMQEFSKDGNSIEYLNPFTGEIFEQNKNKEFLPILIMRKKKSKNNTGEESAQVFTCPKCEKRMVRPTDFSTKGNEPFYNLVSEQFYLQPKTIIDKEQLKLSPNGGRKVLLFSDSRKKAAQLALDLTRAADRDAFRIILIMASILLKNSSQKYRFEAQISYLYAAFIHVVIIKKVKLFYGNGREKLTEILKYSKTVIDDYAYEDNIVHYKDFYDEIKNNIIDLYNEELLYHICSKYNSLTDLKLCYLAPSNWLINKKFKKSSLYLENKLTEEEFVTLYSAWAGFISKDSLSFDKSISNAIRENINPNYTRFGDMREEVSNNVKRLIENKLSVEEAKELYEIFILGADLIGDGSKFLMPERNILVYDDKKKWYRCKKCSNFIPFIIDGKCINCGSKRVSEVTDDDLKGIEFYTKAIYEELNKPAEERIITINTMEHTAQLNTAKENEDETWTKAESYEMRFQDVILNNEEPIDILSCTTTMEVGVDIGSLTAIGLRDVPPLVENYQQRVGRAGRRGTSISTILTFVENGPHDNYYFNHPEEIITGELRKPWIDVNNSKLIGRHLSLTAFNQYMLSIGETLYSTDINNFIYNYKFDVLKYLKLMLEDENFCSMNIPYYANFDKEEYYETLCQKMDNLTKRFEMYPEQYKNEYHNFSSSLDALVLEGIFPNYSFPKNVLSLYIEDKKRKLEHAPSRPIEVALNEYAPGKVVVIDKKTYKIGGFYMHNKKNPFITTKNYLESEEYYKTIYTCKNEFCNWMGNEQPEGNLCPFCGEEVEPEKLLKPWGFGVTDGKALSDTSKTEVYTSSSTPIYAIITDDKKMKSINGYSNILVENRYNQKIAIVNKGANNKGFTLCKKCGACIPNSEEYKLKNKLTVPFREEVGWCSHLDTQDILLGTTDLITDMVLYKINIDSREVECSKGYYWIRKAANTLLQGIILAATKLLDIDYNELKGGYRVRRADNNNLSLEIFVFDSLTSGAGYSSIVSKNSSKILDMARKIFTDCNCQCSCHNCLENFYNQSISNDLDRFIGIEILDYIKDRKLPKLYSIDKQYELAKDINKIFDDKNSSMKIDSNMNIKVNGKIKKVVIYPGMISKNRFDDSLIRIPDYYIENALPIVYEEIVK